MAYFDISIGSKHKGRVTFKLYEDVAPLSTNNFKQLCIGNKTNKNNVLLSYKNCRFHRVIPGFMCQSGDFTNHNGTGGESIYGGKFNDEPFIKSHNKPYLLSMANAGPNTNKSQFFITFDKALHLDNKHVVFGEVIDGFDIIKEIENVKTDKRDSPTIGNEVIITDCGVINNQSDETKHSIDIVINKKEHEKEDGEEEDKNDKHKHKKQKKSKKSKSNDNEPTVESFQIPDIITSSNISQLKDLFSINNSDKVVEKIDNPPTAYVGSDGITYKGRGRMLHKPVYKPRDNSNYDARIDVDWHRSSKRWDRDRNYRSNSRSRRPRSRSRSPIRRDRSRSRDRYYDRNYDSDRYHRKRDNDKYARSDEESHDKPSDIVNTTDSNIGSKLDDNVIE